MKGRGQLAHLEAQQQPGTPGGEAQQQRDQAPSAGTHARHKDTSIHGTERHLLASASLWWCGSPAWEAQGWQRNSEFRGSGLP